MKLDEIVESVDAGVTSGASSANVLGGLFGRPITRAMMNDALPDPKKVTIINYSPGLKKPKKRKGKK